MTTPNAVVPGFPERVVIKNRDDIYLRFPSLEDADDIYDMIVANPHIADFQYWARSIAKESNRAGVRQRIGLIKAGKSVQYRVIANNEPQYRGIVGTITAYDYDEARNNVCLGYYQAKSSQGKGRIHDSLVAIIDLLKAQWGIGTIEFDIENENIASQHVAERIGAIKTDEFRDSECEGKMIPNRIWRLTV